MVKMTSKAKNFPLFLSGLVAVSCLFSFYSVYAGNSGIDWLEVGSYAVYSFAEKSSSSYLGFDDCAVARLATGNYSWQCVKVEEDHAMLEVEINLLVNGSVTYVGKEFVEKANNGDLSFIKRIPMDQVVGRIQVMSDMVRIPRPIYIQENLIVTVDLNTMELIDESEKAWGKWVMWINPLKYPLEGETLEPFIMNWLNTTVDLDIRYCDESTSPRDTVIGKITRIFAASRAEPFENDFLAKLSIIVQPSIVFAYIYEARSGLLLKHETGTFLDDVLTQKLGIIFTWGSFVLSETDISIDEADGFDLSAYIPHLAILGIAATIAAAYLIKKMR